MAALKIRFVNSNGFIARSIDWVTNSLFDHVEIESEVGSWIGAHDKGGVQDRPANYMDPIREYRYAIPCTDDQLARAMAFARERIGTTYNFAGIAGLLFHDRKFNDIHSLICSQFTFEWGTAAGIYMLNVLPGYEYLVTPETLHLSPLLIGNCTYKKG